MVRRLSLPILACLLLAAGPTTAEEPAKKATITFMGTEVEAHSGRYLITSDVNVRDEPKTSGKRLGGLEEGERITAVGRDGSWYAVRQHGKDLGFIYSPVTVRVLDGVLEDDIRRSAKTADGTPCEYNIHYEGSTQVADMPLKTADYEVWFRCAFGDRKLTFPSTMFMTEGPYSLSKGGDHQITLDLPQVGGDDYEEVLSTTVMYDPDKGTVTYESSSLKDYATKPETGLRDVSSMIEALAAAVETVLASWTDSTLEAVAKVKKARR